ncbi:MAG: DUF305 domain-containing protein [Candidatus Nanopelagicales bacterium]|jgi:uncharacterized protein (DUF305 family)
MRSQSLLLAASGIALATLLSACSSSGHLASSADMSSPRAAVQVTESGGDISFAQGMIPHHAQAVEMSDLALIHSASPQIRVLAEQIKAAQGPEIDLMGQWLTRWGAPPLAAGDPAVVGMDDGHGGGHDMDMGGHDMGGTGMMSAADMENLESAHGESFDRMWLEMMIEHHEGAVVMAQEVLRTTEDPDVRRLAQGVINGQEAEIETMRRLLAA